MAFSLKHLFKKDKPAEDTLGKDAITASGAIIGTHQLGDAILAEYTPQRVASILTAAEMYEATQIAEYFRLADKTLEREFHYAGVLNGLVLAVSGLNFIVKPPRGDTRLQSKKLADECQRLFDPLSPIRQGLPALITQGLNSGVGVANLRWDRSDSTKWVPEALNVLPSHWFTISKEDGHTVLERGPGFTNDGHKPLEIGRTLCFTPKRISGLQLKNGYAWLICWLYVIKNIILKSELAFIETFGPPVIIGKYKQNAQPADVNLLKKAVAGLGNTFRAVLREDIDIELKEIARSGTDIYEKFCRYADELISKIVWAATLTSDAGASGNGSLALGKAHADRSQAVINAVAVSLSLVLQQVIDVYCAVNYGDGVAVPQLVIEVEGARDMVAESTIVKNLSDAGVELVQSEVREQFGYRDPVEGEAVLSKPAAPPAPVNPASLDSANDKSAHSAGCPVHDHADVEPDALDIETVHMFDSWQAVSAEARAHLVAAAEGATDVEDMQARLLAALETIPVEELQRLFSASRTKARIAGEFGATL